MKKVNINYKKIGEGLLGLIRSNSGTIMGGLSMIGLALLCKKLNIPFDVLTDPYGGTVTNNRNGITIQDTSFMLVPNNSVEASIAAICDNAKNMSSDYYKAQAVDQIVDILGNMSDGGNESAVTYAVMCIRAIATTTNSSYYRNQMIEKLADIAKGDF